MAKLNVATAFNIELDFEIATIVKRSGAYLLDVAVAAFYVLLLNLTIFDTTISFNELFQASYLFLVVLPLYFYHFISEVFMNGQSVGKKILGIRVVNINGNTASTSQYLLRWILSLPNIVFIYVAYYIWVSPTIIIFLAVVAIPDVITMAVNKDGKRIGDLAANTVVVNTRYKMDIDQTIFREVSRDIGYTPKYPAVMNLTDKDINGIRNLLQQKRSKDLSQYATRVAARIETVLNIKSFSEDPFLFFEELLTDYNYYTQTT